MGATPLNDLQAALAAGQAVVVVGAGVAVAATGNAPAASWSGLLEDGVAFCDGLLGSSLPAGWAEIRRAQLASGDAAELISAAEEITRRLGGPGGGEYLNWLEQSVGQLTATRSEVPDALAALGVPLATTNYDGLLEQATGLPAVTWREGARVEQVLRGQRQAVLHLHGYWEDPASVVLGIRSYETVLGDAHAEAMRKALAATRTLVFVGCGAGLADPNFAALRRWLAEVFVGSPYRHYRLGLEGELQELWKEHGLAERIIPLAYGTSHDHLAEFLRKLRSTAPPPTPPGPPGPAPRPSRLPPPPRCFGRDTVVEDLVTSLLAEPPPPIPVLGPAGVGKSTVCLAALHEPRVAQHYRERRWFVRCNAATSGEAVLAEVAATLGLPVGPDLAGQALAHLAQAPAVVVLDNAETPWWADAADAEATFATLAAVPGLALVASLRGRQRPFGLAWRDPIDVAPLATPEARKVFLAVAGQAFQDDPHLDLLVGAQDGLPLTTTLLAYQAEGEPTLEGLWHRWTERRLALLERGVGGSEVSVQASFDLSITSEPMTELSRRLLSLLGVLPEGIAHQDLDVLLPGAGDEAAARLRKIGLGFDAGSRLRLLQPIRDHVQTAHPPRPDDLARAGGHYGGLARTLGWQMGLAGGAEASSRLLAERGNLEAMLAHGLKQDDPRAAVDAAIAYAEFMRYSGVGTTSILEAAASAAGQLGNKGLQAQSLFQLGVVAYDRSDSDTAQARYEEAQPLFEQVGDLRGQADCIQRLGDIAIYRDDDYDTAQARYEEAQPLYERAGNILGQANCIQGFGDIARARSDNPTAEVRYEEALVLYQQLRDLYSIGWAHRRLARIAGTDAERRQHVQAARTAWTSIGRTDLLQQLEDEFGED